MCGSGAQFEGNHDVLSSLEAEKHGRIQAQRGKKKKEREKN